MIEPEIKAEAAITILNYRTEEKTRRCINSCLSQEGISYLVIVVDNNSQDGSYENLKEEYKGNRLVRFYQTGKNYGFAGGNNRAVSYVLNYLKIKYTLMLNSDTELRGTELLSKMVSIMKTSEEVSVVAPCIYNVKKDNSLQLNSNDSPYLKLLRVFGILPKNKMINGYSTVSEAQGSALLVDNEMFTKVGGFPEYYFMYGEESCFAKRIIWGNRSIVWYKDNNNYVLHFHDKSKSIDNWRLYLMGRNRALEYYEYKRPFGLRWTIAFFIFKLHYLMRHGNDWYYKGLRNGIKLMEKQTALQEIFADGENSKETIH